MTTGRRSFLTAALALAGGVALGQETKTPEIAKPGNPLVYHFKIGDFDAWSISDGHLLFRNPMDLMWPVGERPEMLAWLERHGERTDGIPLYINILVVRIGKEIAVFDAGFGAGGNPDIGWFARGLGIAGIRPEEVTAGFLSHSHADHLNGFVKDGRPYFPNAAIHFLPEEYAFWHGKEPDFSKSNRNKGDLPRMIAEVRGHFETLREVARPEAAGTVFFGGAIVMEAAPGHTAGHAIFRIRSGKDELLHLMDLSHHHGFMFHNPEWNIAFDHDPALAIDTRKKVFAQAAASGVRSYGFHVPWPGLGRVLPAGEAYQWYPERWTWGS